MEVIRVDPSNGTIQAWIARYVVGDHNGWWTSFKLVCPAYQCMYLPMRHYERKRDKIDTGITVSMKHGDYGTIEEQ